MKKKLLLIVTSTFISIAPASLLSRTSWPMALATPFVLPLITGNSDMIDSVLDGLNFDYARERSSSLQIPRHTPLDKTGDAAPVEISYQLRWGYKGAGNPTQPFAGIKGSLNVQLNYDGISFQLCKSRSLRKTISSLLRPLTCITPCQEFYFKLGQLAWTISQTTTHDAFTIKNSLQTLISRLKLTEGGTNCLLYSMPILSTPDRIGLETYLEQSPDQCVAQFIVLSQKCNTFWTLLTGAQYSQDRAAYFKAVLDQIDYYHETDLLITLPNGGWINIPFTEIGSGDADEPFAPTTLTLFIPATETSPHATEASITLGAEQVCILKAVMLVLHNRKSPLPTHQLVREISTLCSRFASTPLKAGQHPSTLRTLLGALCSYHQAIMNYSFAEPIQKVLSHEEFLLQLCRVGYHAYILSSNQPGVTPQDTADFITVHTADALRCYEGVIALRAGCSDKTRIAYLENNGVQIKWDLFAQTFLAPLPEE